jgi:hypothetical protein
MNIPPQKCAVNFDVRLNAYGGVWLQVLVGVPEDQIWLLRPSHLFRYKLLCFFPGSSLETSFHVPSVASLQRSSFMWLPISETEWNPMVTGSRLDEVPQLVLCVEFLFERMEIGNNSSTILLTISSFRGQFNRIWTSVERKVNVSLS